MTHCQDSLHSAQLPSPLDDEFTVLLIQGDTIVLAETFTGIPYIFELQGPGVLLRCETREMCAAEQAYWAARQAYPE